MTVTTAVVVLPRRMAVWATRRALARTSLTGIWLACAIGAAAWFSAGTRGTALAGGAMLAAGYLARRIGKQLAVPARGDDPPEPPAHAPARWEHASGAPRLAGAYDRSLAGLCALAGELAVYAGLAAGAGGQRADWELASAAAALLGTRAVVRRCRAEPDAAGPWPPRQPEPGRDPAVPPGQPGTGGSRTGWSRTGLAATASWLLAVPGWERALLITVAAATYGARAALLVLIWAGAVGLAWVILTAPRRSGRCPEITGCRDDGPIARFAGSVVRGQLAPLPPAVAGLLATVLLAVLGLHGLAGPVLLTPVAAMLLAAPGSAHPHDGPADWLAPAVVQAGEYVYLVALGFAKGVPGPLTCALIALVALRQLDVAQAAGHPGSSPRRYGGIGWEGRMLAAGTAAMIGLATFSFLALAAYLGWQLCCTGLSGWAAAQPPQQAIHPARM